MKVLIFYFSLCLSLCFANNTISTVVAASNCLTGNAIESQCKSPNYPNDYKQGVCECNFKVDDGYQIEVIVDVLDLDSSEMDNLLMSIGPDHKQYQFAWFLNSSSKSPKKFLINKSEVSIKFEAFKDTENHKGFSITLKKYGELVTTVEPTTEVIFPTPVANDSIYHKIYLEVTPNKFKEKYNEFKLLMVNMTKEFCEENKFEVIEDITVSNIIIQFAQQCEIQWPNSENCVEIKYAIPVVLNETKYELVTENLIKMWNKFGSKYLHILNWNEYEIPNNNYHMFLWLITSLVILIAFLTFLFFIKGISLRISHNIKRRPSDTEEIITNSNRASDASLWPMSSQIVPPLFEHENRFVDYEPDPIPNSVRTSQITQPSTSKTMIANIDDLSDDEILDVTNNSTKVNFNQNQAILNFDSIDTNKESAL